MATVTTQISLADNGRAMTLEEFMEAEFEEGYRYELGRGVLEVTIVPTDPHGVVVWKLYQLATIYHRTHPGLIYRAGGGEDFCLWLPGMISGRNPDFAIALKGMPKDEKGHRPPELIAEVVSKSSIDRDYRIKREEYLVFGIHEYWIVDFLERKLTLLVRRGDVWAERKVEEGQPIPSLVLTGLEATLADLWLDLDEPVADAEDD